MNTVRGCVFLNAQFALGRSTHVPIECFVAYLYVQRRCCLLRTAQVQLAVPKVHYTTTVAGLIRPRAISNSRQTGGAGRTRTDIALGYHTGTGPVSDTNTAAGCCIRRRDIITPATAYLAVCCRIVVRRRSTADRVSAVTVAYGRSASRCNRMGTNPPVATGRRTTGCIRRCYARAGATVYLTVAASIVVCCRTAGGAIVRQTTVPCANRGTCAVCRFWRRRAIVYLMRACLIAAGHYRAGLVGFLYGIARRA